MPSDKHVERARAWIGHDTYLVDDLAAEFAAVEAEAFEAGQRAAAAKRLNSLEKRVESAEAALRADAECDVCDGMGECDAITTEPDVSDGERTFECDECAGSGLRDLARAHFARFPPEPRKAYTVDDSPETMARNRDAFGMREPRKAPECTCGDDAECGRVRDPFCPVHGTEARGP